MTPRHHGPDYSKPVILVVDDTPENLSLCKNLLTPDYLVKAAINGETALKIAWAQPPDLILLDVMMPEMDGYEVCRRLLADEKTRDIPIIFVTAMGGDQDELEGLSLGAVDYVKKPIVPRILKARVSTQLALKKAREELEEKNRQLRQERALVENIVERMRTDVHFDKRHLRFFAESLEKTNGDVLFSAFRPDGTQHVLLGDFTGHGLSAAIGGPLVSNVFYSRTRDGYDAQEVLMEINTVLYHQLPIDLFMAAGMVEISAQRDLLRLWNAAIPDFLFVPGEGEPSHFESTVPPLGIVHMLSLGEGTRIEWNSRARLYLFSDGLIEPVNSEGEMFGDHRLAVLLMDIARTGRALEEVLGHVKRFCQTNERWDDMTLLEIFG